MLVCQHPQRGWERYFQADRCHLGRQPHGFGKLGRMLIGLCHNREYSVPAPP